MKIKLGDFYPRLEFGWPEDKARRCHKLGGHAVEIQGGLGVTSVGAKHGDADEVKKGLSRIEMGAEEIEKGLPEAKEFATPLKNRAKLLFKIVEPYRFQERLPKKTSELIEDQVRAMGDYEFKIEGLTIQACGGPLSGAHSHYKDEKVKPLPKIPPEALKEAKGLKAKRDKKSAAEVNLRVAKMIRQTELRMKRKKK